MINITLIRMGVNFYDEKDKQASDMENFRLRPQLDNAMPSINDMYLKDKDGHYIAGDFEFHRANKNSPDYRLGISFTDYGEDMQDSVEYEMAREYSGALQPTIASIKSWLELVLGDEVALHLEPKKENEEV